jgi:GT2 family glycosyltransferase
MTTDPQLSISIVVHNQAAIAQKLLDDINALATLLSLEVIFTINIDEPIPFTPQEYHFPLKIIRNKHPKGFGANHNLAFAQTHGRYYCVLNPDIRLIENPFPPLIECLRDRGDGVVGPRLLNPAGSIENTARRYPTPFSILKKALAGSQDLDYPPSDAVFESDWIGGMFMLFSRNCFEAVQGFDERYFLYYEDVDICARLKIKGQSVLLCPHASAIHDGRADSHHDIRYLQWHLRSMVRFFTSKGFYKLALMPRLRG